MMNVLVTGASGLIGRAVCHYFIKQNWFVTGLKNKTESGINHQNYRQFSVDLTENTYSNSSTIFDAIIHCAAILPSKNESVIDEHQVANLNKKIDKNVFLLSIKNRVKIIYLSTAYLYKNQKNIFNENSALNDNPKGYYQSKKNSEEYLVNNALDFVILRVSSPYGNISAQSNVMKLFYDRMQNNLPITFINNGERKQNFIHLDDIAKACFLASVKSMKGIYNLTYKESYTMLQLASFMKAICRSNSKFIFDSNRSDETLNVNFDNSKLKLEFGWEPEYDLQSGLIKTLIV